MNEILLVVESRHYITCELMTITIAYRLTIAGKVLTYYVIQIKSIKTLYLAYNCDLIDFFRTLNIFVNAQKFNK